MTQTVKKEQSEPVFTIERIFDVPVERMWRAWTDPEQMKQWWGPKGFKTILSDMDLRTGGTYHYGMQAPDGSKMWGKFTYREVAKPDHFTYLNSFSDEHGGVTRHPLQPDWPLEWLGTIAFADVAGKTKVSIRWTPHNPTDIERKTFADSMQSMTQGWTGTLDQLAEYLIK